MPLTSKMGQQQQESLATDLEVVELDCAVQKYAWGKLAKESLVAKLYAREPPERSLEEEVPYAEVSSGSLCFLSKVVVESSETRA
jgi:hypothetical protein